MQPPRTLDRPILIALISVIRVGRSLLSDELLVSMRAQSDVNGCKFIATNATKLKKLREPQTTGDNILFTAVKRGKGDHWTVVKWTARGFRIGSDRISLADSYTQTAMSTSEITLRYFAPTLGSVLEGKPTLRSFLP
ncbi:unnamed protein product [Strongylus vulgaris]|uniref:Uncharacterized protein n=1 Tax=Strongylus vulgaris TaxID=40348 RepID=A0A3P7IHL3_STRVU|nr:unnamed protein product [Strongylus vulgaris]